MENVKESDEKVFLYWAFMQKAKIEYFFCVKAYNIMTFFFHYIMKAFYYYPLTFCACVLALCVVIPCLLCKFWWNVFWNRMKKWIIQIMVQELVNHQEQVPTPSRRASGSRGTSRAR